jgi:hypothetical protein
MLGMAWHINLNPTWVACMLDSSQTAVLAAAPVDLQHQLTILLASLHPLAAFLSIRRHQSLTLDFNPLEMIRRFSSTAHAELHTAHKAASALRKLELSYIAMNNNDTLLQLIGVACTTEYDVSASFSTHKEFPARN